MLRLSARLTRFSCLILPMLVPVFFAAQAASRGIPPEVERQLRVKARMGNPPAVGLHRSQDGESYTYASAALREKSADSASGGYQVTLGRNLREGIEVSSGQSELSLKFWPVRDALFARRACEENGKVVYRAPGVRYEFAFLKNGLKEDIVLDKAPAEDVNLAFAFQRDGGLEFQLDGKGNVLVYGSDPVLSGFVQTGDERSAELVMKARRNARKSQLLYLIPAPVVVDADGKKYKDMAHFTLDGCALTLHTEDLSGLAAPVTIDPSVVISSTADFLAGNNEGMISFDTDAISRAVPSGGMLGSWSATTSFPAARYYHASVVYNGYLYVLGGFANFPRSDVQFAPIHSDGTVGAWSATTSLPAARYAHTSVAYNGYVYAIGGYSGAYLNDVQFAAFNPDGTVGAWNSTTGFATARAAHSSVAWNGYLYVIGGTGGSSFLNDVQFAPVNANGTLGNWVATTSFSAGRGWHTAAAWNGYLYVTGGYNGSYLNDVQYARIHADGTAGAWGASTSLPTARGYHSSVAWNGYLYVIGGYDGSLLNGVQYAPIHAGGTVGAWSNTTGLAAARYGHASAAFNGYLYVTGGTGGFARNDVQYVPISSVGAVGAWSGTTSLPFARYDATSVVNNGYLYVMGGDDGSQPRNNVQYAPINPDGTVGAWSTTTSLPTGRERHTSVSHGGYLYVIGGYGFSGVLNDVQFAPINSNGTVGAWSTTTSFSTGRCWHTSVVYNGYLYVIGGWNGSSALSDVQFAPINPDGTVGAWSATTSFSTARYEHASVAYNGYLYVICGWQVNDVQYAPIHPDGTVGAWGATTGFPTNRFFHTSVACNGYLYVVGGWNGTSELSDVQFAMIHSNGTVGAWSATTGFSTALWGHTSFVYNGYLYALGGSTGTSLLSDVQFAPIAFIAGGTAGAWDATAGFPTARYYHASVAYNGYLYVIGGYDRSSFQSLHDVRFAPINPDGTVGAWSATTSFPTARYGHTALAYNGYLYVMGGYGGSHLNDVQFAPIHADGTVGDWDATAAFSTPRYTHASAAWNGYLYVIGGYYSGDLDDVQFAPINSDGTLGAWNPTTSLPFGRGSHAAVAYNGTLYVLGGFVQSGYHCLSDVLFAPIQSDGSVGAWNLTTELPVARYGHTSAAWNGYLYVLGGYSRSCLCSLNDVQFAPISSNGAVGDWGATTSFFTVRNQHASVVYNGYLYVIGGFNGSVGLNDVQSAALAAPAARGAYSRLLDLGADQLVDSIMFDRTPGRNGITNLTYALAPSSTNVFGPRTVVQNAVSGTYYTSGMSCARYLWARFDLDDTQSATTDDGGSFGRDDVLDFTVTYYNANGAGDSVRASLAGPSVHLTWDSQPGATGYSVKRCDATSGPCTPATIATPSSASYDDPMQAGTQWYSIETVYGGCAVP